MDSGWIFRDLFYIYCKIPDIFGQWRNIWDLLYLYCKIPDIFWRWKNMVGSIFYVLQNFWRFIGGGIFWGLLYLYRKIPDIDKTDSFWKWQEKPNQYSDQIVRWPQNSFETLQEFWSEFWWPALVSNHSNDFWVLGRIRWPRNSCEILQGLDDFKK